MNNSDPTKENFEKIIGAKVVSVKYKGKYSDMAYESDYEVTITFNNGHKVTGYKFADEGMIDIELSDALSELNEVKKE